MTSSYLIPTGDLQLAVDAALDRPPVELPVTTWRRMARERVVTRHRAEPDWFVLAFLVDLALLIAAYWVGRAGAC